MCVDRFRLLKGSSALESGIHHNVGKWRQA